MDAFSKIAAYCGLLRSKLAWLHFQRTHRLASDEVGIVMQHGIGDHFIVASLARAIGETHGSRVVLAGRRNMAFIAELFPVVARFESLPRSCVGMELGALEIAAGQWTYGHFRGMSLAKAIGYKDWSLIDVYRCLFELPTEAQMEAPRLPNASEVRAADQLLRDAGYQIGRTVVLGGTARSTPVSSAVVELLALLGRELPAHGWSVLRSDGTGSAGACAIPLELFRAVACRAGAFIGVRSGLCDLVCGLPMRTVALYSDLKYQGGPLITGTSLRHYGFTGDVVEYAVSDPMPGAVDRTCAAILASLH